MKNQTKFILCSVLMTFAMVSIASAQQIKKSPAKEECNPPSGLTVRYTADCDAELQWAAPAAKIRRAVTDKNILSPAPAGMVNVTLESRVSGYQGGYQLLLDQTATQYGLAIPENAPLSWSCNGLAEDFYDVFSHKIPENAEPVCTTPNIVANGAVTIQIPVGTYDWCVADVDPAGGIFIAGANAPSEYAGRRNDFMFEEGYDYHIFVRNFDTYVGVEVSRPCAFISNLNVVVDERDAILTWDAASGSPTGYQIIRNGMALDTVTATTFTDSDVLDGMYTYGVTALFEGDCDTKAVYAEEITIGSTCGIRFELFDAYGVWDGDAAVRIEVNGSDYGTLALETSSFASVTKTIPSGEVKLYWIKGDYDGECYLEVYDHNDQLLWASPVGAENGGTGDGMYDSDGLFFTYQNDCSATPPEPTVYRIYRDGTLLADNYMGTSYADTAFDAYQGHTWSVRVVCEGAESEPASVTLGNCRNEPPVDECYPPTALTVDYTDDCEAELTWNAPTKNIPVWDFANAVRTEKPHAVVASAGIAPFLQGGKNREQVVPQGNASKSYAEAYLSDYGNKIYSSVSLTSGAKTAVGDLPDMSAFPTGEDYDGVGLYRLYSNGLVVLVHEDGTVSEVGQIAGVTNSIGLAYDRIGNNGIWYFFDIPQIEPPYTATLYALSMESLKKSVVAVLPSSDAFYRGLTMSSNGTLYSIDITSFSLVKFVDNQMVHVGPLGFPTAYGQDLAFDIETNTLFASPFDFTNPVVPDSKFGTIDTATGAFSTIRNYTGGEQHTTLSILKGRKQDAPAAPDNFTVTPINTSLRTDLSWNNPSTTLDGNSLPSITKMVLLRNGEVIQEFANAALGGAMHWRDKVPNIGKYTYSVYAVTAQENGAVAYQNAYNGDFCLLKFAMADHYQDGWGTGAVTVTVDDIEYGILTLEPNVAMSTKTLMVPSGELKLSWTDSDDNQECGLLVYNANDELIFASGEPVAWTEPCVPGAGMCELTGLFYSGQYDCGGSTDPELYNIYRDHTLIVENHPSNSYTDKEFDPNTAHIWAVSTVCAEEESDTISVSKGVCESSTIADEMIESDIKVYPNPVQNTLHIQSSAIVEQILIYDLNGRLVKQIPNPTSEINVSDLSNGTYLLEIKTSEGKIMRKIVKE